MKKLLLSYSCAAMLFGSAPIVEAAKSGLGFSLRKTFSFNSTLVKKTKGVLYGLVASTGVAAIVAGILYLQNKQFLWEIDCFFDGTGSSTDAIAFHVVEEYRPCGVQMASDQFISNYSGRTFYALGVVKSLNSINARLDSFEKGLRSLLGSHWIGFDCCKNIGFSKDIARLYLNKVVAAREFVTAMILQIKFSNVYQHQADQKRFEEQQAVDNKIRLIKAKNKNKKEKVIVKETEVPRGIML